MASCRGFLVSSGNAILSVMARYTETVMVRDGGRERAVRVTLDAPAYAGHKASIVFIPENAREWENIVRLSDESRKRRVDWSIFSRTSVLDS